MKLYDKNWHTKGLSTFQIPTSPARVINSWPLPLSLLILKVYSPSTNVSSGLKGCWDFNDWGELGQLPLLPLTRRQGMKEIAISPSCNGTFSKVVDSLFLTHFSRRKPSDFPLVMRRNAKNILMLNLSLTATDLWRTSVSNSTNATPLI